MGNTKAGGRNLRETMIKKHGSEEAWKKWIREIASFGGQQGRGQKKGFAANRELARKAGRVGGTISKRKPKYEN